MFGMDDAITLRNKLLKADGCTFDACITADYGEKIYIFKLQCLFDDSGNMEFCVLEPETIFGIRGQISAEGGKLTFDDQALMFETIADGQISPISAPWVLIHTLCGGYIKACGNNGNGIHIQIDDSYEENALQLDILTDENIIPLHAEVLWKGRRIVSIDIENFIFV